MALIKYFKTANATRSALIQMHISVLLWGITGVLGRSIDLSEGMLVWYRLLLTIITLTAYAFWTKRFYVPKRKALLQMGGVGILLTVHWLFFYGAIKYSNISITLSMLASSALLTSLIEWIFFKKPLKRSDLLLGGLAMAGIWIIFLNEKLYFTGIVLAMIAALLGAFFNISNKPIVEKHDSVMVSLVEIFVGFMALSLFLPYYISYFDVAKLVPTTTDWVLLSILAFVCTHLTLILSLNALRHLDAFTLNLSINLEPVYGIALAFLIFHEHELLTPRFYIGGALIFLSVLLHGYYQARASAHTNKQLADSK